MGHHNLAMHQSSTCTKAISQNNYTYYVGLRAKERKHEVSAPFGSANLPSRVYIVIAGRKGPSELEQILFWANIIGAIA